MATLPDYAELRCSTNFSFLKGSSWPREYVERAKELGYSAIAITDECSMAGVVRAHVEAKEQGLKLLVGSQFDIQCDFPFTLVVLATKLNGYGNLCQLVSKLRRRSEKGTYEMGLDDVLPGVLDDCVVIACPTRHALPPELLQLGRWLFKYFLGRAWLGIDLLRRSDDEIRLLRMRQISVETLIPLVAVGNVTMHRRSRKPLLDVMTATRIGKPLTQCGKALDINAERHLRTRGRLARTFPDDLLAETLKVADRCNFSLDELAYQYPSEVVPEGETATSYLRQLTYQGAGRRWPDGIPAAINDQIERELELISDLKYEHYFLTVADVVMFARSRNILCQGRGSAANSVVCFCCGITEVDPARMSTLFERFISKERDEPPDIDVDFEHQRREEVIQHIYSKYGRDRAALTAVVTSYRVKSSLKDVGKALGFELPMLETLSGNYAWWDLETLDETRLVEVGLDITDLAVRQLIDMVRQILGMPRHMSQHPGGFVLTQGPLTRIVPVENASMENRTVIQWDKDDIDAMKLLKVDVLGLGMLTAIRKSCELISLTKGYEFSVRDIPPDCSATYDMICAAETIGVFQIESRAQRAKLPVTRPRKYYDLVIQVAVVRPGPIQGGMVGPYEARRQGKEAVTYPSKELEAVLERTLGIPLFQEQVMQIAMVAAGYTGGQADELRRDMAAWKRKGGLDKHYSRIVDGMVARGYEPEFAEAIFAQIQGFSSYGFPESHAASFALLVWQSCWIKHHHPAEFLTAMLNSQPLGFYSPSQLVQDAKRHGVVVLPADVMRSEWDCVLEPQGRGHAVRLGLRLIEHFRKTSAEAITAARQAAPFDSAEDLALRAGLNRAQMTALASGDALMSLSGHRRQQVWDAAAPRLNPPLLSDAPVDEDYLELEQASESEEVFWDYASLGLTLRTHELALLRPRFEGKRLMTSADLRDAPDGRQVYAIGKVTGRQRPETAKGVTFISLEDEFGDIQVIVYSGVFERFRQVALHSRLLGVKGRWQCEEGGRNLIAGYLEDHTPLIRGLRAKSRDFK
ncbi:MULTISPECIES: error-prone DNA polymerase [unclassified Roseateles]|uniref:error-prone DNA polymerase n=1 Tax=unclassified Roseateles TaxID=2626991 RepID=UPI00070096B2|nr:MULTISPECIES: error-prone DNA polymerase [unclassified Roseateles]KQW43285.1 DNA polymerase [Pelomonas sp. Root405]KRA71023.1 DNA polymerase [Pelomonas sp. Root662]